MSAQSPLDLLPAASSMGAVTLQVHDLDKMVQFYRDGLGMQLLDEHKGTATLGRQNVATIVLDQDGTLAHAPAGAAGLYHTAFLFDDPANLASAVYSVAQQYPGQFQGASDHLVSEAFYFGDPEGNGVEMYVDRARDTWQRGAKGEVQMATLALDPNAFLQNHLTEAGATVVADTAATVGHVHLKVGSIATAREFYVDTVGFEVTFEYGSQALFVSAGGYHHHLGLNTWESMGAGERTPALGLGEVVVQVPAEDDLGALDERLAARGVATDKSEGELTFFDPWRNRVRVTVQ